MSPDSPLPEKETPSALSRRGLIRNAAGAGAVGLAAGTLLSGAAGTAAAAPKQDDAATALAPAPAGEAAEPLIVHLHDPKSGALDVFQGERHRRVLDPGLAAALRNAAR
ncbi:hypothetical protein [Streptacidiphilus sp. P02-A3a]|uniref:hypothetical protein n=1 Tax=Streptacidiphilus sp. P02-A3a TaxID=2704468 RepID=UPI0015FD0504|nr:hypothetical protein [Streptacidiphilus sp. P02-A3a]QMU66815.1 hypothetical protein GXP74_16150 [Streptacidiphilus sp. P02-A3a]